MPIYLKTISLFSPNKTFFYWSLPFSGVAWLIATHGTTWGPLLAIFGTLSTVLSVSAVISLLKFRPTRVAKHTFDLTANFDSLLETAPDAIVICNEAGELVFFNSQAEQWFGYQRQEVIGRKMEVLLPRRIRERHIGNRINYNNKPTLRPMGAGSELYAMRRDGSEFPVEISLSPMKTPDGVYVTAILRDVSERKKIEIEKAIAQERYLELVQTLPVGVFTTDTEGNITDANQMMATIFETNDASTLLGQNLGQLFLIANDWRDYLQSLDTQTKSVTGELPVKTRDGKIIDIMISAMKKHDRDGNIKIDGVIQDISQRKQSERRVEKLNGALREQYQKLEENNRELESFSYSVSHDLRAPLRAIDGFSRTLVNEYSDKLDERGLDRLKRVRVAAQNMGQLIDDLLSLSRITRQEVSYETVDLTQVAKQVLDTLAQAYPDRKVDSRIGEGINVKGDARLLRTVLDNLLGNAWKFSRLNSAARIEFGRKTEGGREIFFVKDNGVGFDMQFRHKLFGAFQRLHDAQEFPGSGIGLATVLRAVKKHGGHVWADSELGKGATFYFDLEQGDKE